MLNDKLSKRFQELQDKSDAMEIFVESDLRYFQDSVWLSWATSAQSLIKNVFGENSPHYINFTDVMKTCSGYPEKVESLQAMFLSAKEAFEGGYVFDLELGISGEIFGDFVVLAKQSLADGHKDVAAVLASAALEDTLKRYAKVNGLNVEGATMTQVISAIKSKGLVSGATKSLLDIMPRLRNYALHAEWEKVTEPNVNSIIGFVEQFLLTEFSP